MTVKVTLGHVNHLRKLPDTDAPAKMRVHVVQRRIHYGKVFAFLRGLLPPAGESKENLTENQPYAALASDPFLVQLPLQGCAQLQETAEIRCRKMKNRGKRAAAGAAFQALFSNPLATADTLGVSTGAAFGAVLGILLGLDAFGVQTLSLGVGLVAVFGVWRLSLRQGRSSILLLILSGLVVAALFSSLISLVKFAADPQDELPAVTFWLMGSLTGADWKSLKLGLPFIVIGSLAIWVLRWKLNALSLSEDEAKSLGLPVARLRFLIVTAATAVTAACVSMCGLIGWVGLLIPHFVRLVCGSDNRTVVPASFLFGAVFLLVCDTIARSAAQMEIPVSVLTSLVGAPIFLMLLRRKSTFL